MSDIPMKHYWMGNDIETLSREELLKVIDCMARQLAETQRLLQSTIEIHSMADEIRVRAA